VKTDRFFYKEVDLRSRKDMIDYLRNHPRYHTMNSWNNSTSYANNVKIYRIVPTQLLDRAYDLLDQEEVFDHISVLLDEWAEKQHYKWKVGFNGRSGGYLVLYQGEPGNVVYPGRSTDMGETFESWDMESLRERVKLIQSFDELCDNVRSLFLYYCENYIVEEVEVLVPQKRRILKEIGA